MGESVVASKSYLKQVEKDVKSINDDPVWGIYAVPDEKNPRLIHALIIGPKDTPYQYGFFYFTMACPTNYPFSPPEVKLVTRGESEVRFHPNIYQNGTVCLSILGNTSGPQWAASQRLSTVLLSIQSLLDDNPFFNSPFIALDEFEMSDRYNEILQHETLRVAVCDMLEGRTEDSRNFPQRLRDIMERNFMEFYDNYESVASSKQDLTGKLIEYPKEFGGMQMTIDYASILKRLHCIKDRLEAQLGDVGNPE